MYYYFRYFTVAKQVSSLVFSLPSLLGHLKTYLCLLTSGEIPSRKESVLKIQVVKDASEDLRYNRTLKTVKRICQCFISFPSAYI